MPIRGIPELPGYEFRERIGRGAGADILLAVQRATGRPVAVKHIVRRSEDDDRFIAQAENEFAVARRVEHEYLRRCYDLVRIRKWLKTRELFLIMEYVDGERLEDHRPSHLTRIIDIFLKVAAGLHALHGMGFAHADMKPNNILLTRDGGLKIIDFGQSCPLGHAKQRIQGTPDYMAPEQVYRNEIDQRTDVFNLGATLYWVLTGKWFRTVMSLVPTGSKKIALESNRGNAPPHELNPRIPLPLSRLTLECCAAEKARRPRDMREIISRLEVVQHLLEQAAALRRRRAGRGRHRH